MELITHLAGMVLAVIVAIYIAIKYDEYEKWNQYKIRYKVTPLVRDPVDGEWEFVRKQRRFEYIETTLEKIQEEFEADPGHYSRECAHFERCA